MQSKTAEHASGQQSLPGGHVKRSMPPEPQLLHDQVAVKKLCKHAIKEAYHVIWKQGLPGGNRNRSCCMLKLQ